MELKVVLGHAFVRPRNPVRPDARTQTPVAHYPLFRNRDCLVRGSLIGSIFRSHCLTLATWVLATGYASSLS
jgi:hypothetical protein